MRIVNPIISPLSVSFSHFSSIRPPVCLSLSLCLSRPRCLFLCSSLFVCLFVSVSVSVSICFCTAYEAREVSDEIMREAGRCERANGRQKDPEMAGETGTCTVPAKPTHSKQLLKVHHDT